MLQFLNRQALFARSLLLACIFLSLMIQVRVSHGQQGGWSEPVPLSPSGQFAWFPDIAVDLSGRLHVVYSSGVVGANRAAYDSVMYVSSPTGEVWSTPNDIFALPQRNLNESAATRPTIFVDSHNILHAAYTNNYQMYYSQVDAFEAANARSWAPVQQMASVDSVYFSRLIADKRGRLHFFFTENVYTAQCPICYHLYHRSSDDNGQTWSLAVDVSRTLGAVKPQAVVDVLGGIHVVWVSGAGGTLGQLLSAGTARYSASYDGGATWTLPLEFGLPVTETLSVRESLNVAIGVDARGQLVVSWLGLPEERLYYQLSTNQGRSWSEPLPIEGVWASRSATDTNAMVSDSAGKLHLFLVGRREKRNDTTDSRATVSEMLHLTWDGEKWSSADVVTRYLGDVPEWPRPAIKNGNELHLVWFVRNREAVFGSDSRNARYQVWYSRTTVDAPPIPPGPIPTRAPSATPTAAVTATPNALRATPTPTFAGPLPTPSEVGVYRENDYLLIAARSALPVVGLVLLTLVVVWWRRR